MYYTNIFIVYKIIQCLYLQYVYAERRWLEGQEQTVDV